MSQLGIVIIHYGSTRLTRACLTSIQSACKQSQSPLVVVINNDQNPQLIDLKKDFPVVATLITPHQNYGYAAACNLGMYWLLDKPITHIMLLNNDTLFYPDTLDNLKFQLDQCESPHGICAPVIEHTVKGKKRFDYGGKIMPYTGIAVHTNKTNVVSKQKYMPTTFVSGCCMIVSVTIIPHIGLLREDLFLYFEDVDYCLRAGQSGFSVGVLPKVVIQHIGSQSVSNWQQLWYGYRNSLRVSIATLPALQKGTAVIYQSLFYLTLLITYPLKKYIP